MKSRITIPGTTPCTVWTDPERRFGVDTEFRNCPLQHGITHTLLNIDGRFGKATPIKDNLM